MEYIRQLSTPLFSCLHSVIYVMSTHFQIIEGHSTVNYIIAIFLQTQAGTLLRIKYLIITFTSNKL